MAKTLGIMAYFFTHPNARLCLIFHGGDKNQNLNGAWIKGVTQKGLNSKEICHNSLHPKNMFCLKLLPISCLNSHAHSNLPMIDSHY